MTETPGDFAARTLDRPDGVLVICGPTASGKSGLALALAAGLGGTIINADSMQVYHDLSILTARPGAEALAALPHRLYGLQPATTGYSVARWRADALEAITTARALGQVPLVVGGTGLYLRALMVGLAEVPEIPPEIRSTAHQRLEALGAPGLHAELCVRDAAGAARLRPGDSQRLVRAWEVLEATGRPLGEWQRLASEGPPPGQDFRVMVLDPPRPALYQACDGRFQAMLAAGALDEVRALEALQPPTQAPILKALGVPELRRHLAGDLSLTEAIATAQRATRNYAKRQVTWFRHQVIGANLWPTLVISGP